jgi:hypothetical protein
MSMTLKDRQVSAPQEPWRPLTRATDFPMSWYDRTRFEPTDADAPLRYASRSASSSSSTASSFSTTQ